MLGQLDVARLGWVQWWVCFGSDVGQCWFRVLWHDVTRFIVGSSWYGWIGVIVVVGSSWFRRGSV